jgi:RNA polymerase sigma factor (sigma-70 family)
MAKHLWGPDSEEIYVPYYNLLPLVEDGAAELKPRQYSLTREQEKFLFLRYNYAKYRYNQLLEKRNTASVVRKKEQWCDRAVETREKLVHANLPLVPAMAKKSRTTTVEFEELVSEGYMTILRCVERFDVSRGFKFSTYACRAILAGFRRMGAKSHKQKQRFGVSYEPEMEQSDFSHRRHTEQRDYAVELLQLVLQRNKADLTKTEETVVRRRFAVSPHAKPNTLSQLGRKIGVSNERVRQIESRSLTKLKDAMEEQFVA